MKIASLYLNGHIVVPEGQQLGPTQAYTTLREQSFHSHEGWDIRETLPGVFSLHHEGMSAPVTVGGYGYSYVAAPPHAEPITFVEATLPTAKKGKR